MSELSDLEQLADLLRPDRTRRPTPALTKAGAKHWARLTSKSGQSIQNRVLSSRANRKVTITLAPIGGAT